MPSGIPPRSADRDIIENRLRSAEIGEMVTYEELSTLIGRDVREFCRGHILSSRRVLESDGYFFDPDWGVGLTRVSSADALHGVRSYVRRASSASRRGLRRVSNINFENLTDEQKREHLSLSAQLGAIKVFTGPKAEKKIANAVDGTLSKISFAGTVKLFTE